MALADELEKIRALLRKGDLVEADKALAALELTGSNDWELKQLRGWWFHDKGNATKIKDNPAQYFEAGIKKFREALAVSSILRARERENDAETIQGIAACLRLRGRFDEAEEELRTAGIEGFDTRGLRNERAWLWRACGDEESDAERFVKTREEAAEAFEHALEKEDGKNPQTDQDFIWPAQCWREAGKFDKAEEILRRALPLFPNRVRLDVEYGWINFYRRDFAGAIADFDRALKADPKLDPAIQGKVAALREIGGFDDALAILDDLESKVQAVPGLRSERAWIALAKRQPEKAADIFEELAARAEAAGDKDSAATKAKEDLNRAFCLLEMDEKQARLKVIELCRPLCFGPLAAQAYGCLGVATFGNGDVPAAEYYLKQSVAKSEHLGWHADLIRLYTFLGRMDEARQVLAQATRVKPNELALLDAAGELFAEAGDLEKARDCYRQGLRRAPHSLACLTGYGKTLLALKEVEAAETLVREGLRRLHLKDQPPARLLLARILFERFQQTSDQRFLDEALVEVHHNNQQGNLAEAAFHEGVVRFKRGELREARAAFVRASNIGGKNALAEVNAERIRVMLSESKAGELARWGGYFIVAVAVLQMVLVWQSWIWPETARWFDLPDAAALVLIPLSAVMMVAGFSLPFLTKFSVSGVEIELVSSGSGQKPEGPVGHISFYEKVRGGGLAH